MLVRAFCWLSVVTASTLVAACGSTASGAGDPAPSTDSTLGATTSSGSSDAGAMSTSGGLGGASAIGSAGGAGSGGSAFDCSHHVVFQPHGGAEELSVGTFCDELFVCLPDSETVTAAQAALPDLSCGTEGTPFENVPEVDCPSADLVCQWSGVQDLSEEELANLCEVTSLTAQVDWVICRVFL